MIKKLINKINDDDNYFYLYLAITVTVIMGTVILLQP